MMLEWGMKLQDRITSWKGKKQTKNSKTKLRKCN